MEPGRTYGFVLDPATGKPKPLDRNERDWLVKLLSHVSKAKIAVIRRDKREGRSLLVAIIDDSALGAELKRRWPTLREEIRQRYDQIRHGGTDEELAWTEVEYRLEELEKVAEVRLNLCG